MRTKLKLLRVQKGMGQKEIAEKIGISAGAYSYIERGKRFGSDRTWGKIKELFSLKDKDMWDIQHEE